MKKRIFALLLSMVMFFALTACSAGSVAGLSDAEEESAPKGGVPKAVLELSEEDEILLNGELKKGEYTNRYFGIRITVPEGGTLTRVNDEATESTQIISLAESYEKEENGLFFWAEIPGVDGYAAVIIKALEEDQVGMSEEELAQKDVEDIWEINSRFEVEGGPEVTTMTLAGEEHPASLNITQTESGEQKFACFFLPKGNFICLIDFSATGGGLEDLMACVERI